MLKHIVLFRLKDPAQAPELVLKLEELGNLPMVGGLETGVNVSDRPIAWDVGLYVSLQTEADLEAYRVHPDHQTVLAFIKEVACECAVVDFHV
ncbi:MAG: Dabb family protein [Planctomycetota bacterium]